jgi:signal transduction histidine kinase
MNKHLQEILNLIQQGETLSAEQKTDVLKSLKDADKELEITTFKLDRTEKVKRTTAILLEETIEELEQKRKAVEAQNRELEVESSLEKVRTVAMGMRTRDDMLDICQMMSKQLEALGIKEIRNVQTAIFYKNKGTYVNYEYYRLHDKTVVTEADYTNDKISIEFAARMMEGGEEIFIRSLAGKEVTDWYNFQKTTNVFIDTYLETATSLTYYWFSLGPVALGLSSYLPLTEGDLNLFKRFRNVFGLAYQRYIDIETAEAQAREAQIELGLERVRARAMAMQNSDELKELISTVFIELTKLDLVLARCVIMIYDTASNGSTWWMANSEAPTDPIGLFVKYHQHPPYAAYISGWQQRKNKFQYTLEGKDKQDWDDFLFGETELSRLPDFVKAGMRAPAKVYLSGSFNNFGCLNLATLEPLPEEHFDILLRFARVFDLTYTRFNDLQKAEAQAREAKIEAALERTRTQSMIMQHSKELDDTLRVFHEQILLLGIRSAFSFLWLPDEKNDRHIFWAAWEESNNGSTVFKSKAINYPLDRNEPATAQCLVDWKGNEPIVSYHVPPAGVENYFAAWQELIDGVEHLKPAYFSGGLYYVEAFMKYGCFGVMVETDLIEDEKKILGRFAIEFERTYTRFLDLQKAEAQARESQIQLAMERVRARTMAMQRSDELSEAASLLFQQVQSLGAPSWTAGYCIWDEDKKAITLWMSSPSGGIQPPFRAPLDENPTFIRYLEADNKGMELYIEEESGKVPEVNYQYLLTLPVVGELLNAIMKEGYPLPTYQVDHCAYFSKGFLLFITYQQVPELHDIFKRFAAVFDQTYIRFLDLQKAEAQAREAKIEAALERTRTQSMIMQHSKELDDTLRVFHEQVLLLGIQSAFSFLWLPDENNNRHIFWAAWKESKNDSTVFRSKAINYPLDRNEPATAQCLVDWKSNEPVISYQVPPHGVESYFAAWQELIDGVEQLNPEYFRGGLYYVEAFMRYGCFGVMAATDLPDDEKKVLGRFAIEFERTYTRFLDLQKAEAQAREAQIEAALERVRSRTMAMQKSTDLGDTSALLFGQLNSLVPELWTCGFVLCDRNKTTDEWWLSGGSGFMPDLILPHLGDALHNNIYQAWLNGESYYEEVIEGEALQQHYDWLMTIPSARAAFDAQAAAGIKQPVWQQLSCAYFSRGYLVVITEHPCEEAQIFKRFAQVFEQTYTRFLDLQKAESQAREAQIEAALERVRSRSMGMQKSEELKEVIRVVYEQFVHLNIHVEHAGFIMDYKERDDMHIWLADQHNVPSQITIPYFDSPHWNSFIETKAKGLDFFANHLSFEEKNSFYQDLFKLFPVPEEAKDYYLNCPGLAISTVLLDNVGLYIENFSGIPYSDEENATLMRFGKVFQQTHTRFLDLQKAEMQAREAKIEAGLERVRYSAMAMQSSEDVGAATAVVFHEIALLGVETMRCCITVLHPDMTADVWAATATNEGKDMKGRGSINFSDHPLWVGLFDAWKNKAESFSFELKGDNLKTYYKALANSPNYDSSYIQNQDFPDHFLYATFFDQGAVFTFSLQQHDDYKRNILKRFTAVFSLTFRRYLDLQKAEAQALEAIKRASVDRVRAEIASMRTTNDLEKITPLVWNELTTLSVPFIRCGVFIMDEEQQLVHTFLSTPEGKAIATLHVPFEFNLSIITNGVDHWRKKERYQEYWDSTAFTKSWVALSSLRENSGDPHQQEPPPENLHLHMLPFVQGMLYVGNVTPLNDVELQLVQNLADAFSTAYARYEDFNKLESANFKIERTLVDLKQAQAQLVQSEKMASLGELTAGIAHEIQNPLNFVNNFSDVNTELIEELKGEWEKVHGEKVSGLAEELFTDIVENEKKINHHGKRADAIVKGMLQHSRSTGNVKEPTDINVLADEYLRLAYHGLRAKDKSFNAALKTEYDESIVKINVIPQDIGRVILNVITNAFYAVNEKQKQNAPGYEPMVSVRTKNTGDKIIISVRDNGNGIPKNIVDKIFQPFFTTKPTGQGTGLGLSLAYDIVKAHGGELKVETKEARPDDPVGRGEGSAFIIKLPIA